MTWQPIETAPRDGAVVLLWGGPMCNECGDDITPPTRATTARWSKHENLWHATEGGDVDFFFMAPTHWMPLPAPPTE